MVAVSRTFVVDKDPATTLAYLADFSNAPEWDHGTQTCAPKDDSPVAVGKTWLNTSKIAGVTTQLDYTITELDDRHVLLIGKNKTATSSDKMSVRPHPKGCEVTYDAVITFNGAAKLGTPVIRLVFEYLGNKVVTGITAGVAALPKPI